ncbi:hypothetical protein [Arthrobacter sp. OAP107]
MAENLNVFDFTLDDQDMARITAFDTGRSIIGGPGTSGSIRII